MIRVLSLLGVLVLAGCYHEVIDERVAEPTKGDGGQFDLDAGDCRITTRTGCFEGQVPSAPEIRVKGKSFFDVDSLRIRFKELIAINDAEGKALKETDYELTFLSPFDNRNFASGMEVYLKGDYAKSARVLRSGRFSVHELPQGEYEIRVQKMIPFQVTHTVAGDVREDGTVGEAKTTTKTYCATLYSESSVDVRQAERSRQVFDEYEIYLLDRECAQAQAATKLSL